MTLRGYLQSVEDSFKKKHNRISEYVAYDDENASS